MDRIDLLPEKYRHVHKTNPGFVTLSLQGPETLKDRCEMLVEHKREVEEHIEEMNRYLEKVTCKISYFTQQYEDYLTQNAEEPKGGCVKE